MDSDRKLTAVRPVFRGAVRVSIAASVLVALLGCRPSAAAQGAARLAEGESATVLITGSNRGIGLEFARQYAEAGWDVIATARNPDGADALRALAADYPKVVIERLDVTDHAGVDALAARYRDRPIDVLINNAGVLGEVSKQRLDALDYDEFQRVMAVNTFGPLRVSQAFLDHVAASDRKKIVVVTSISGSIEISGGRGGLYFYNISKAGVNMAMRSLGSANRDRGILMALIHPGGVNTDMLAQAGAAGRGIEPSESVAGMIQVIHDLDESTTGTFLDYTGRSLPW
ncbi:MAG: SDR family oxidoreductase [Gemmatimonadetes bacterium]|nr:SDR family oxidoreductase [Gemmatimonadota bacterium]